jgi:hypothetical protein
VIHGPRQPEHETLQQYVHRIVSCAPPPTPEECAELAALLRLGRGDSVAT